MIELPEAFSLSRQIGEAASGKKMIDVIVEQTAHKLAWYYGDKKEIPGMLIGKRIDGATSHGGLVEIKAGGSNILFGDGVNIRFHEKGEQRPQRHQMLIELDDGSALSAVVQMYGGIGAFADGGLDNPYYLTAKQSPSPLSKEFDLDRFTSLVSDPGVQKMSLKALLATKQRIPGLGNGVLQDILFDARMHPKRKVSTLNGKDREALFQSLNRTLAAMAEGGGRDTETDLYGHPGRYQTVLSKRTMNDPCPACGGPITKEAYMGGTVYYCANCQTL